MNVPMVFRDVMLKGTLLKLHMPATPFVREVFGSAVVDAGIITVSPLIRLRVKQHNYTLVPVFGWVGMNSRFDFRRWDLEFEDGRRIEGVSLVAH